MGLGSVLSLMKDGPHAQIVFYIGIPDGFWIPFLPVVAEDITSPGLGKPLEAINIFFDIIRKSFFTSDSDGKKRSCPVVSFKETSDLPFYFLFISDSAFLYLFGKLCQFFFKTCDEAIENGVFFLFSSERATEYEGLILSFR